VAADYPDEPAEYVAGRLREAIAVEPDVHELGIQVQVTAGRVRVAGSASTPSQRQAITDLVHRLAPDLQVLNEVELTSTVEPDEVEDLG
jgi:osmotically-inducible protein OsmY